jgi:hypothetical protein
MQRAIPLAVITWVSAHSGDRELREQEYHKRDISIPVSRQGACAACEYARPGEECAFRDQRDGFYEGTTALSSHRVVAEISRQHGDPLSSR